MSFVPKTWVGRSVQYPGRIRLIPTGEDGVFDVQRAEGEVTVEGDLVSDSNLNDQEQRIASGMPNSNLLHNWYFQNPVNQRGVSGTISTTGYFIDRWHLTSGSVTLTANGLTLNGTITQILEYAVGTDVTASVSMYSGTATISYNNSTKTVTITSSGGTVRAAKLEKGTVSTLANDAPPDFGAMLSLCQRYYRRYGAGLFGFVSDAQNIQIYMPFEQPMRVSPTPTLLNTSPPIFGPTIGNQTGSSAEIAIAILNQNGILALSISGFAFSGQIGMPIRYNSATDLIALSADL